MTASSFRYRSSRRRQGQVSAALGLLRTFSGVSAMSRFDDIERDSPMTPEEQESVAALSDMEIERIDNALLVQISTRWQKLAMVVGSAMSLKTA